MKIGHCMTEHHLRVVLVARSTHNVPQNYMFSRQYTKDPTFGGLGSQSCVATIFSSKGKGQ